MNTAFFTPSNICLAGVFLLGLPPILWHLWKGVLQKDLYCAFMLVLVFAAIVTALVNVLREIWL